MQKTLARFVVFSLLAAASPLRAEPAWSDVDAALGRKAVVAFSIPRAEPVKAGGVAVAPAMGTAIAINFQPTGDDKAAVSGDFVARGPEVQPLLKALQAHGVEVTALHNHMLDDEPRLFFVHFWADDDAVKLAHGLRAGLNAVHVATGS